MKLLSEEVFAINQIFNSQSEFGLTVCSLLEKAIVVERKTTGVGYFSTIKFPIDLPETKILQWDWNFKHKALKHGGSFIACYEAPNIIELEAVVHDGLWPKYFNPNDFQDIAV